MSIFSKPTSAPLLTPKEIAERRDPFNPFGIVRPVLIERTPTPAVVPTVSQDTGVQPAPMTAVLESPQAEEAKIATLAQKLASLEKEKKTGGGTGRPAAFSQREVELFYEHRKRGITWTQINRILDRQHKRAGALAQSVHSAAEHHGIPAQRAVRPPRKSATASGSN